MMIMSKIDYCRAVLLGAVIAVFFTSMFYVLTTDDEPAEVTPPKSNFTVIDQYKGCDVVRWTQSNFAEYKYFLHCDKK